MNASIELLALSTSLLLASALTAQQPAASLPVRELTVFKDGHAFVLREGPMRTDEGGRIVLDGLPEPVLGTFWPYATAPERLVGATASRQRVLVERTAVDLRQWLLANASRQVRLVDNDGRAFEGELIGIPARSAAELERDDPSAAPSVAQTGSIVLIRNGEETTTLPIERIRDATAIGGGETKYTEDVLRERLTLQLERQGGGGARGATVGLVYVQEGLRWIPSYRVDVDGAGHAAVELEATLVNDLIDFDDATVHLVIGVPHFEFAGHVDPMALQATAAAVGARVADPSQYRFSQFLSNANVISTQAPAFTSAAPVPDPDVVGGAANEDLFVFTLEHVTLKRGERMVLPVTKLAVSYRDVYVLHVTPAPPFDLRQNLQGDRIAELARLLAAPKAEHVLRVKNDAKVPFTTAPALVLRQGRVLAQGLLTYTPTGAESDLEINKAIDLRVDVDEQEVKRTPDAIVRNGTRYERIDLSGKITVVNRKAEAVDLEVTREVFGLGDGASDGGVLEQLGLTGALATRDQSDWWSWWSWPWWWWRWNGVARVRWTMRLEPGNNVELGTTWHYFWQ